MSAARVDAACVNAVHVLRYFPPRVWSMAC